MLIRFGSCFPSLEMLCKKPPELKMVLTLLQLFLIFHPQAVAIMVMPTRPPLNFSIMMKRMRLPISSYPCSATFNAFNACFAIPISFTLLNKSFAIQGVPQLLLAVLPNASDFNFCTRDICPRFVD
jgi:hypothetical protein